MKSHNNQPTATIPCAPLGERANYARLSLKDATPEQQDICWRSSIIHALWQEHLAENGQIEHVDADLQSSAEYFEELQAQNLAHVAIGEGVQLSHYPSATDHPEGSYFVPTAHDARLGYAISNPDTPEAAPVPTTHGAVAHLGALSLKAHALASSNLSESDEKKALSTLKSEAVAIANQYASGEAVATRCKVADKRDHTAVALDSFTGSGNRNTAALLDYVEHTRHLHANSTLREVKLVEDFIDGPLKHLNQDMGGTLLAGREGYLAFAATVCGGNMKKAYIATSKIRGKKGMAKVDQWQALSGTVADWHRTEAYLRTHLEMGTLGGVEGYLAAANTLCGGDMYKAYRTVSTVVSMTKGISMPKDWQAFNGTVDDFRKLQHRLEDKDAPIDGINGYIAFADEWCGGDMFKARQAVSAVVSMTKGVSMPQDWRTFSGTVDDFRALQRRLEDKDAPIDGIDGYIAFADEWCGGDMFKVYIAISAVVSMTKGISMPEGWQAFNGTVDDFRALQRRLEDKDAPIDGIDGYMAIANEWCGGDMLKTHMAISAVAHMTGKPGLIATWRQFRGTVAEYHQLHATIQQVQSNLTAAEDKDHQTLIYERVKAFCQGEKTDKTMRQNYNAVMTMSNIS